MSDIENSKGQIAERVYRRQVELLYSNQPLAVASTAISIGMLMFFLSIYVPFVILFPWVGLFSIILLTRALATWVFYRQKRIRQPINVHIAERIYFAGVVLTAASWSAMTLHLFPVLDADMQILYLLTVQGFIAVSHNTMGYRRLPYLCYTLLLSLPVIYVVYQTQFSYPVAIILLLIISLLFVLRTANEFYKNNATMLYLQEESISREHKLLLQREQASLANQAKTEFLSRMSHELRTPLNAVLGMNELQMLDKNEPLSRVQQDRAEKINEAGKHLLSLVNDVLDLSRIEAGSLTVKLEPIDIQQTIRDACKLVENRAAEQRVTLAFEALPEPAWVMADSQRMKQVVVNLLDNAVKYNRLGGHVTITLSRSEIDRWRISVVDTGYGIALQDMPELFKPFARLEQNDVGIDGAGIGLSFSKQLVDIMNGKIGVDSRVGEGSCFWVEMQATDPVMSTSSTSVSTADTSADVDYEYPYAANSYKLLLAEDNLVNQEVALEMLRGQGFEVDVANNGEEALKFFEAQQYSLVLMDCEMPVMDGLTAARKMREREKDNKQSPTPIVALTAHAIQGAKEKCLASGMDDFVSKPFSYSELRQVLARWVKLPEPASAEQAGSERGDLETPQVNNEILDTTAIMRLHTRKASLVERVVKLYLEQSPGVLDDIEDAVKIGDTEKLSNIVHTFKSSSLTVGAVKVADICWQIEADCQQGIIDTECASTIRNHYLQAEQALQTLLDTESLTA